MTFKYMIDRAVRLRIVWCTVSREDHDFIDNINILLKGTYSSIHCIYIVKYQVETERWIGRDDRRTERMEGTEGVVVGVLRTPPSLPFPLTHGRSLARLPRLLFTAGLAVLDWWRTLAVFTVREL